MPSLSSGIQSALQAVLSQSQAIDIISHNIANVDTPGYTRQAAVLATNTPSQSIESDLGYGAGLRGTGVKVDYIQRFSLDFYDGHYRSVIADAKSTTAQHDVMVQVEQTMGETTEDGLGAQMDQFWSDWQTVAANPADTGLRSNLLANAGALTNAFNQRAGQLNQIRADQNEAISSRVDSINSMSSQIAQLNSEISRVIGVGEQPNDYLDKRDLLLDQLAEVAGATSSVQQNGQALVSIGGHVLVNGQNTFKLQTTPDTANDNLNKIVWEDQQSFNPGSGELKGLLAARDNIIPQQQTALNSMAQQLMTGVNAVHVNGFGSDGTTGLKFFINGSDPLSNTVDALSIRINPNVTPAKLAVAGLAGEAANSDVATAIANMKTNKLMSGGTATLNDFYSSLVTQLGQNIQTTADSGSHLQIVVNALSAQRESVSGVSLDEEAANLQKSQKAYQAAAKIMTVYGDLFDTIINGMGVTR